MERSPIDLHFAFIGWPMTLFDSLPLPKVVRFIGTLVVMIVWLFPVGMVLFLVTAPFVLLWELWEITD